MSDNYHWKSKNTKASGVDDMVLISKIEVSAISENLHKRMMEDIIYTYIGRVLIALNPFKLIDIYGDAYVEKYNGSISYEHPPHIYSLGDDICRNLHNERESQCCIISGESGAGKTVSAKHIMNYIIKVSGGGSDAKKIKNIILQSNPLLEAFGNAKTLRNDNSSRFGKYVEIQFQGGTMPQGGRISNFLLEKSRVVSQNKGERNFHIFYQILSGLDSNTKQKLGLTAPANYCYLNQSGCTTVDSINDTKDFKEVVEAIETIGISGAIKSSIFELIAGILHLGNVSFDETKNQAQPTDPKSLNVPSQLFQVDTELLKTVLITREMESKWGKSSETIKIELNKEQASYARDAISKAIYNRIFNWLVDAVNLAIEKSDSDRSIGILDIYGFEIFQKNGFEQFCINYVNEKLQQIFIELTLKVEQEEYVAEGIKWEKIKYFNNKIVCDLIESKSPPGIMSILDDVCATMHAKGEGADQKLIEDLSRAVSSHEHFNISGAGFIISHYAGKVTYDADGFCERNRDVLFNDPINCLKSSKCKFLADLFSEDTSSDKKGRPTTASAKIKTQAQTLVERLMKCQPHYIRCIKPNESKKAHDYDEQRVKHQIEYQGLKENIRIKRAGFAYRREDDKFLERFAILTKETFPKWKGNPKDGIKHILNSTGLDPSEWQLGKTKVFIKKPESLFLLEEQLDRIYDKYAIVLQKIWRKYHNHSAFDKEKLAASQLVLNKKKRFQGSINRKFVGNYISLVDNPGLRTFVDKKEKIEFSCTITKYDRRFKPALRDMLITCKAIYLIGRELIRKGEERGKVVQVLKRKIPIETVASISLSPYQDDFLILHVDKDYDSLVETPLKTELIFVISKFYERIKGTKLSINFSASLNMSVKKQGFRGGAHLVIEIKEDNALKNDARIVKASMSKLLVTIKPGEPSSSAPRIKAVSASNVKVVKKNMSPAGSKQKLVPEATISIDSETAKRPPPTPQKSKPPPPSKPSSKCIAIWAFESRQSDELGFNVDDTIEIIKEDDSGWWKGKLNGKTGVFPSNYVKKL